MKQFTRLASVLIGLSLMSPLCFAQMSLKGEVMPAQSYNWTGFYAGLNIGAVDHTMYITDNQATTFNATIQQVSNPKFSGGLQIGYRLQLDPTQTSGVYGVELSANFSNAKFSREYGSPFALYQISSNNQLKDTALLELLAGIGADRTLLFLGAGISWTNVTGTTTNLDGAPFFNSFNVNNKAFGTVVSAGIEYAFMQSLSARVKIDVVSSNTYSVDDNTGNTFSIYHSLVQGTFGINYKFC